MTTLLEGPFQFMIDRAPVDTLMRPFYSESSWREQAYRKDHEWLIGTARREDLEPVTEWKTGYILRPRRRVTPDEVIALIRATKRPLKGANVRDLLSFNSGFAGLVWNLDSLVGLGTRLKHENCESPVYPVIEISDDWGSLRREYKLQWTSGPFACNLYEWYNPALDYRIYDGNGCDWREGEYPSFLLVEADMSS